MRVTLFTIVLTVTLVACLATPFPKDVERSLHHCKQACGKCGGTPYFRDDVCFCQVKDDTEHSRCMSIAKRTMDFLGIKWIPVAVSPRGFRRTRPARGSVLDADNGNIIMKTNPAITEQMSYNSIQKPEIRRIFKRSLPTDPTTENQVIKRRVPREDIKVRRAKSIMPEISDKKNIRNRPRYKRSYGPYPNYQNYQNYQNYPRFDADQLNNNMYELVLEYPTSKEQGDAIQMLFPNTQGLDIEHEFYYQDEDDDDDDCADVVLASMVENPYEKTQQQNPMYSNDYGLRDARSPWTGSPGPYLWARNEPLVCQYNLWACW